MQEFTCWDFLAKLPHNSKMFALPDRGGRFASTDPSPDIDMKSSHDITSLVCKKADLQYSLPEHLARILMIDSNHGKSRNHGEEDAFQLVRGMQHASFLMISPLSTSWSVCKNILITKE